MLKLLPILMGKKESRLQLFCVRTNTCRGTLFLSYVKEVIGHNKWRRGILASCLHYIGERDCRGTLFPLHNNYKSYRECRGTLSCLCNVGNI